MVTVFFSNKCNAINNIATTTACCDNIDVNIDLAEEIEDEIQNEELFLSDCIPESYSYNDENGEMNDEIDLIE